MSLLLDVLLAITAWSHVLIAPYTKVEESFNLHGMHDTLMHGWNINKYDHFIFPGAVPRTFIGSTTLASLTAPVIRAGTELGFVHTKFDIQIILRLSLATLNALGLALVRRAVSNRFGRLTSLFFTLLTCSQFHLPFWMGRTVPNMFALFLVNVSTFLLLNQAPNARRPSPRSATTALSVSIFAAAVFRAEIALFLGPLALQLLITRTISFRRLTVTALVASLFSVATTVAVDSYFWGQPLLWPEFSGIYFNVIQGKSAEWGVSPPLTYFTSFLPKLLLSALPLSLVGFTADSQLRRLMLPALLFVYLISFLGHKEWRFIIYVVPTFNIAAARTCKLMVSRPKATWIGRLLFASVFGFILANMAFTTFTTYVSIINYPGGEALRRFHDLYKPGPKPIHVHISNLAAQTGASLFLQLNAPPYWQGLQSPRLKVPWIYNKTEGLDLQYLLSPNSPFTHLIVEELPPTQRSWTVVEAITAFDGVSLDLSSIKALFQKASGAGLSQSISNAIGSAVQIRKRDKLWILERR